MTENAAPLFSIVLPTHNRPDVLHFAIRSVLAQTIRDFELLIVGDGCTDQTAEIVKGFDDARITWFDLPKAPNFGYANRNIVLRQVRGKYIAFMAHDDLWLPDHLERFIPAFERPGIELAYSQPVWVSPDGKITPTIFNLVDDALTLEMFLAKKTNRIPAACVVHRRECLDRYGYWDDSLPREGDLDMWGRIIKGGGRQNVAYLRAATCLHFRADWKKKNSILDEEIVWDRFYALAGFMPDGMKINVPVNMTEQQATWQVISVDAQAWSNNLREAIQLAFERRVAHSDALMGWMLKRWPTLTLDSIHLTEHINALPNEGISPLIEQINRLSMREVALRAELAAIKGALPWRLGSEILAIKRRLIPIGTLREKVWLKIRQWKVFDGWQ